MRYFLLYKLKKIHRKLFRNERTGDDFNWKVYHDHYRQELENLGKRNTLRLAKGDYALSDGRLERRRDILPLHENHRALYEVLLGLKPRSVMEVGCGWGDHLHNVGVLIPSVRLHGVDVGEGQLRMLKERQRGLRADVMQYDMTLPFSSRLPRVDACYTQAVIMHIQTQNSHLVALANMFRAARKQVVLVENWTRHDFLGDIRKLHEKGMIPWKDLHFHYSPEAAGVMVVSATKLKMPVLKSYAQLLRGGTPPRSNDALGRALRRVANL